MSYRHQSVQVEIFVHDNGSDDPDTLRALIELEGQGVRVFRRPKIATAEDLNLVNETVIEVFRTRKSGPYIVTDCDIDLAQSVTTQSQSTLRC
jgi:hypothetical protein